MVAAVRKANSETGGSAGHRVLGVASLSLAAVHVLVLIALPHSAVWSIALAAMTLWCAKCAWCVLRGGSAQKLMLMCALMAAAHVVMVLGVPFAAGHHNTAHHSMNHAAPMLLIALIELLLMLGAAVLIRHQTTYRQL